MLNSELVPFSDPRVIQHGIYREISYSLVERLGVVSVELNLFTHALIQRSGADMSVLQGIGNQDPETVIDALIASIPEQKPGKFARIISGVSRLLTNRSRPTQPV